VNVSRVLIAIVACLVIAGTQAQAPGGGESRLPKGIRGLAEGQAQGKPPSADWLLDARDDQERFRRIQLLAGGTYEQMWQVGYRYQQVYQAILDENWELGRHHWTKLRDVMNVALMKRPHRTPNAEAMFLDAQWARLEQALEARDRSKARELFLTERDTCMACHIAEKMPFLNDTPIFRDTASFPARK
jgi:hypothetical protein